MPDLLPRFIDSFIKAVTVEMEAMRQRMGSFEVPLADGELLEHEEDRRRYSYRVLQSNDKLVVHGECTLVTGATETLVTILSLQGDQIVLGCDRDVDLTESSPALVIYPWFLYEKLRLVLRALVEDESFHPESGLRLFGQRSPIDFQVPAADPDAPIGGPPDQADAGQLNASQHQAVELCRTCSPAFVWGPPGTGKTTTLGHIVTALLQLDQRILITSTTNAAVDQVLTKFMELDVARVAVDAGDIVRVGSGGEPTPASLIQVVERLNAQTLSELARLQDRRSRMREQIAACGPLITALDNAGEPTQLGLFGAETPALVSPWQLSAVFGKTYTGILAQGTPEEQQRIIRQRQARLERTVTLLAERIADGNRNLRHEEARVIRDARVVLATMSNVYINRLLETERFDTVIVEEAGMAILPTLFYCACLARERTIMVGDPQQLPPIVQSNHDYVHRAMGRGIFAVTVPEPHQSDLVVMLDTQYRMHRQIGDLVGNLFYDGRLQHGDLVSETQTITDCAPFAGEPIIVVDTAGATTCATQEGGYSRYNEITAQHCVDLATRALADGVLCVAIITPYAEQSRRIRRLLPSDTAGRIECRTVHRFQGGERDMVIFDTVDTDPLAPGILLSGNTPGSTASNLINVSLSRARGKLIVIADVAYFRRHAKAALLNHVLAEAVRMGRIVPLS
ncbi:MAG: AAA family ATPase [Gemmatimonadetes bacterium]|nr:AAA family ATPase [Gemmatimonadota bacterium]MBT6150184.1 AAA family ATPase [Gemmatimonadota bacterium]MBT7863538.1 AAA family ATPase [Gemmatimonadota bacterium]